MSELLGNGRGTDVRAAELERLRLALSASGDVVYDWDMLSDAIVWSAGAAELFGLSEPDEIAHPRGLEERIGVADLPARARALFRHIGGEGTYDCAYRLRRGDGTFAWVQDRGIVVTSREGRAVRMVGSLRHIPGPVAGPSSLPDTSAFDPLTGHLNRARLRAALDHALAINARFATPSVCLSVGIDGLPDIVERHGSEVADQMIVGLGQILEGCLRGCDAIGRTGPDRYGVVLGGCVEAMMAMGATKVLEAVEGTAVQTAAGAMRLSVSVGGVAVPSVACTGREALSRSEEALTGARRAGGGRFVACRLSRAQRRVRRADRRVADRVLAALRERRLRLAFQPIIEPDTGETMLHECLLRMVDERGAVVDAASFMPSVERLGLTSKIDRRALELVVAALRGEPGIRLALNISGLTVGDAAWCRAFIALLRGNREVAARLTIEITETAMLDNIAETIRFISGLRELGCKVALDDFGAGHTSLEQLEVLPIDVVKIDGSFVRGLGSNPGNRAFVRTVMDLTSSFGLITVAECVETAEDAEALRRHGIDYLQGHYFGRPVAERPRDRSKPD